MQQECRPPHRNPVAAHNAAVPPASLHHVLCLDRFGGRSGSRGVKFSSPSGGRERICADVGKAGEYGAIRQLPLVCVVAELSPPRQRCVTITVSYEQGRPMPNAQYVVVQHGDEWMIKFDNEEYGP